MQLVCIVCPNGCRLDVTREGEGVKVEGARCKRGVKFAEEEMIRPMRTVTSSVKTTVKDWRVVPVRTDGEIPKDKIFQLMSLLKDVTVTTPLPIGSVVAENVFGSGVNVVTTADMEEENE